MINFFIDFFKSLTEKYIIIERQGTNFNPICMTKEINEVNNDRLNRHFFLYDLLLVGSLHKNTNKNL